MRLRKVLYFIRQINICCASRNRVCFDSVPRTIERNIRFSVEDNGKVLIGKYVWIRQNAQLWCAENAKITIGNNVFINSGTIISARDNIQIGSNTIIGPNVMIYDHDHNYKNNMKGFVSKPISIGSNVWIGANAFILKGVTIGDNCVIGAGTVVTKDIPDNSKVTNRQELVISEIIHER